MPYGPGTYGSKVGRPTSKATSKKKPVVKKSSPQGQIILKDLMKVCGLYTMTGLRPDNELQHMEGGRDLVRRIITILALDEEQITRLALGEVTNAE